MIFFINFIRFLASCFITNAHYIGIYPTDYIAHGGIIGNILFFAVSGYCLYNIKLNFYKWYLKRVFRVYYPIIIITIIYSYIGYYNLSDSGFIYNFIYPTNYTFLSAIVILYIPYYFFIKLKNRFTFISNDKYLKLLFCSLFIAFILIYIFLFDKSYYHIDDVNQLSVLPLYFESMIIGAWFRENENKFRNNSKRIYLLIILILFPLYFASKYFFNRHQEYSYFQIFNQLIVFSIMFFIFRYVMGIDSKLDNLPKLLKSIINYIAKITLEIYVVQHCIISFFVSINLPFPINWILLTLSIIAAASLLHFFIELTIKIFNTLFKKAKNKIKGNY